MSRLLCLDLSKLHLRVSETPCRGAHKDMHSTSEVEVTAPVPS